MCVERRVNVLETYSRENCSLWLKVFLKFLEEFNVFKRHVDHCNNRLEPIYTGRFQVKMQRFCYQENFTFTRREKDAVGIPGHKLSQLFVFAINKQRSHSCELVSFSRSYPIISFAQN